MGVPRGLPRVSQMWVSSIIIDEGPHHQLIFAVRALGAGCPLPTLPPYLRWVSWAEASPTGRALAEGARPEQEGPGKDRRGRAEHLLGTLGAPAQGLLEVQDPQGQAEQIRKAPEEERGPRCLCEQMPLPFRDDSLETHRRNRDIKGFGESSHHLAILVKIYLVFSGQFFLPTLKETGFDIKHKVSLCIYTGKRCREAGEGENGWRRWSC